jgi:hypothetical protein
MIATSLWVEARVVRVSLKYRIRPRVCPHLPPNTGFTANLDADEQLAVCQRGGFPPLRNNLASHRQCSFGGLLDAWGVDVLRRGHAHL